MSRQNGLLPPTDFNLHNLVGIRLIDAAAGDVVRVGRQLGIEPSTLACAPDITIRFVDRLETSASLHLIGVDDAGFADDAFFVLRSKHKARARVRLPMSAIGQDACELVCERGLPAVPLLIQLLNLTALSKGVLPLHAAAFRFRGHGVLATGWSKGGKTETLLAFAAHGAEYIGDEWVYISPDGQRMVGIPEPIRLWDWHLDSMPQWRTQIGASERARLWALQRTVEGMELLAGNGRAQHKTSRTAQRVMPLLRQQLCTDVAPQRLFGKTSGAADATIDRVLFVMSQEAGAITVEPIDGDEVARRMVFSLQAERLPLMEAYLKYRFAFPDARNEFLERTEELQRRLLLNALSGKHAYCVRHPYPVSLPAMFDAIVSIL